MTDEKLTPERAVRLLRAKAGELENLLMADPHHSVNYAPVHAASDLALVASLLADSVERTSLLAEKVGVIADHAADMAEMMADYIESRRKSASPGPDVASLIRDAVAEHFAVGHTVKDWIEYKAPAEEVARVLSQAGVLR